MTAPSKGSKSEKMEEKDRKTTAQSKREQENARHCMNRMKSGVKVSQGQKAFLELRGKREYCKG